MPQSGPHNASGELNLNALGDVLYGVEWPAGLVPTPHGRRLMESLGVVGLPAEDGVKVSAHELLVTRDCRRIGCTQEAEAGIDYCRDHAPVAELRANGNERPPSFNGRLAWTRASIVAAMQRWAAERGSPPSSGSGPMSWAKSGEWWPSVATVIYHFGTWRDAVLAAGLTPLGDTLAEARRSGREPSASEKRSPATSPAADTAVDRESPGPVGAGPGSRPDDPSSEVEKQEVAREPLADETADQQPTVSSDELAVRTPVTPAEAALEPASRPATWFGDLREPLCVTELRFDPELLEDEAAFLLRRAEALTAIAGGIRGLAETA